MPAFKKEADQRVLHRGQTFFGGPMAQPPEIHSQNNFQIGAAVTDLTTETPSVDAANVTGVSGGASSGTIDDDNKLAVISPENNDVETEAAFSDNDDEDVVTKDAKNEELTDDDDDLPLSKVRLKEKPIPEKIDLPASIRDTFETFVTKRNSFTWEAFLADFRTLPASALDEAQLNYVISNTHLILRETLPQQNIFSDSKTDEKNLAKSISYPLFGLYRFLHENEEKSKKPFQTLLTEICERIPESGYLLLYFMKVHVKLQTRKNSQQSAQFKTPIHRLLCEASGEKIDDCLTRDLDMLEKESTTIFLWLLPDIYREFKNTAINNNELLRITLRCIDAKNLRDLIYYVAQGKLTLFKQDGLIDCLRESLVFETFEQLSLWQLVQAHEVPLKCLQVSPGGVGFDINCGVRLLRTNLYEKDVQPVKEQIAQSLFDHIPVGVGSKGIIPMNAHDMEEALEMGMDWSLREGYVWAEDKEHCEEYGRMLNADPSKVSLRAKKRGLPQLGTLGAGNHYAEIQIVDEIYDKWSASKMGIEEKGQVCVMIHSGSRGFGHQVATDALVQMEKAMKRDKIETNDRQLACARINSQEGQDYLKAMAAAANFAWVNRSSMTFLTRQAFAKMFHTTPDDLDMHVIYDVSHNIAKVENHIVNGKEKKLLVHRKGSTRAFPPHHPLIPVDYQLTGQPVLVGGTMGTCSYVLTGTEKGMHETFGSTCHGAGRALSRAKSRRNLDYQDVLERLEEMGIAIRVASPKLVMEEAPESYKDVTDVVDTCHAAGISKKCIKLRPIAVIKG